ncbi:vomeronasal type-1 receptor 4 [Ailuropoda melanoleuca]|nr:vomeronasal type-1 receptor 4 [Ailuropoda melanoleuca]
MGITFLSQSTVGILGNFSLLYHYLFLYLTECRVRSTDVFLKHLTVANLLVIFSKGIPQTTADLGLKYFLSDFACKLVFYVHRVGRDVAIGTTCFLSVSQVITISPGDSRWAGLRVKAAKYLGTSSFLCWVLNIILNVTLILSMTGKRNNRNMTSNRDYHYCYSIDGSLTVQLLVLASVFFRDGFCFGLMIWASSSMASIEHQHKRRVQYIHSNTLTPRPSPETAAIRSILVLVSTFISLWTLSFFFHICVVVFNNPSPWMRNASVLLNARFPTVSPYILMSHNPRMSTLRFPCKGTRKHLNLS